MRERLSVYSIHPNVGDLACDGTYVNNLNRRRPLALEVLGSP